MTSAAQSPRTDRTGVEETVDDQLLVICYQDSFGVELIFTTVNFSMLA